MGVITVCIKGDEVSTSKASLNRTLEVLRNAGKFRMFMRSTVYSGFIEQYFKSV